MEIIVWNDGSTDGCEKIVERLSLQYPCIRLYNNTNHGVSYARNQALKEAHGEYVWFVDSDDMVCSREVLQIVDAVLTAKADAVLFNWEALYPNGSIHNGIHPVYSKGTFIGRQLFVQQRVNMAPWCYIYRKDFLLDYGLEFPCDFKTCEDIQFNQKVLFHANSVLTLPSIGYRYRELTSSATKGNEKRVCNDQIRRLQCAIDYFSNLNDSRFLFEVVYRNLREINVWLAKCNPDEEMLLKVRKVLKIYECPKIISFKRLFVYVMMYHPRMTCKIQQTMRYFRQFAKIC